MKKIFFCIIFIFVFIHYTFSYDYIFLKEYLGKNINIVQEIMPNLKYMDNELFDSVDSNMENIIVFYSSDLTDSNMGQFVIFEVVNGLIIGFNYFIDLKDQYLARYIFEKIKNENLAIESSTIFIETADEYMWMDSNFSYTHIRISGFDDIFSIKVGYTMN